LTGFIPETVVDVDSTMIPVCHNVRRYANKVFKGFATDGKETMDGVIVLNFIYL
jgi:hypothetical protein